MGEFLEADFSELSSILSFTFEHLPGSLRVDAQLTLCSVYSAASPCRVLMACFAALSTSQQRDRPPLDAHAQGMGVLLTVGVRRLGAPSSRV